MAPPKRGPNTNIDPETDALIFQGASMAQICQIFGMDARDVKPKLHGKVEPCGTRRGHPIYNLKDVAPYLVSPPYDIDEFIQKMTIADLPSILRKEFWAGLRSRQLYEKEAAELWPTSKVVDTVSDLFKTLRMSLLLTRERVEREVDLTERQRAIIVNIIDTALEDAYEKTIAKFTEGESELDGAEVLAESNTGQEDL